MRSYVELCKRENYIAESHIEKESRGLSENMLGSKKGDNRITELKEEVGKIQDETDKRFQEVNKNINTKFQELKIEIEEKFKKQNEKIEEKNIYRRFCNFLNRNPIIGILLSAVAWPIIINISVIAKIPKDINTIQNDIGILKDNLKQVNKELGIEDFEYKDNDNTSSSIKQSVSSKNYSVKMSVNLTKNACKSFSVMKDLETDSVSIDSPNWKSGDVVAVAIDGDKTYTAKEVIGLPIMVPYTDGEHNIIFYGQYDESYLWTGNCVINTYIGDKLYLVTDAVYEKGEIKEYKQIIQGGLQEGDDKEWIISERVNKGDYNSGSSLKYSREDDYIMQFDFDKVTPNEILTVDGFSKEIETFEGVAQTVFYYGNTSKGKYNDNTGEAFWIKFDDKGKIVTFYQGQFAGGKFEDHTGKAWEIVHDNIGYFYYTGIFAEGNRKGKLEKNPYLTLDEIQEYISGIDYDFTNAWYEEDT